MTIKFKWPEFVSDFYKRIHESNLTLKLGEEIRVDNVLYKVNDLGLRADQLELNLVPVNKSEEWNFVLKVEETIIDITDIVISSNVIPLKGDTMVIEDKKYAIRYGTYYSDEQIIEWIAYDADNTML